MSQIPKQVACRR